MDHRLIIVVNWRWACSAKGNERKRCWKDQEMLYKRRYGMFLVFFFKDCWSSSLLSISYEHQSHSLSTIFIKEAIFKIEKWKRPQTQDLALETPTVWNCPSRWSCLSRLVGHMVNQSFSLCGLSFPVVFLGTSIWVPFLCSLPCTG